MKYLVLKISNSHALDIFANNKNIMNEIEKSWRITPYAVKDVWRGIVVSDGMIISEFIIEEDLIYHRNKENPIKARTEFKFEEVSGSKLIKRKVDYQVRNPASVIDEKRLQEILK